MTAPAHQLLGRDLSATVVDADRERLLRVIAPGSSHVVAAEKREGATTVQATRRPLELLARLGCNGHLERFEIRASEHAFTIAEHVRDRLPGGAAQFAWHPTALEDAIALLEEYDLTTGSTVERFASPTSARGRGPARITGYVRLGRVFMRLHRFGHASEVIAVVPPSHLKPNLRALPA